MLVQFFPKDRKIEKSDFFLFRKSRPFFLKSLTWLILPWYKVLIVAALLVIGVEWRASRVETDIDPKITWTGFKGCRIAWTLPKPRLGHNGAKKLWVRICISSNSAFLIYFLQHDLTIDPKITWTSFNGCRIAWILGSSWASAGAQWGSKRLDFCLVIFLCHGTKTIFCYLWTKILIVWLIFCSQNYPNIGLKQ